MFASTAAFSQVLQETNARQANRIFVLKEGLRLPMSDTTQGAPFLLNYTGTNSRGGMIYDTLLSKVAYWNGTYWTLFSSGASGVTTMAAIGSSPNANAATISGSTLNLEPASASFGGVLTTGTQDIAGVKTFTDKIDFSTTKTEKIILLNSTESAGEKIGIAVTGASSRRNQAHFYIPSAGAEATDHGFYFYGGGAFQNTPSPTNVWLYLSANAVTFGSPVGGDFSLFSSTTKGDKIKLFNSSGNEAGIALTGSSSRGGVYSMYSSSSSGNSEVRFLMYPGNYQATSTPTGIWFEVNNSNIIPGKRILMGGGTGDASANLQSNSTTQGWLMSRVTNTERNAISSPLAHLIVSNTTSLGLDQRLNSVWTSLYGSSVRAATDADYTVAVEATFVTLPELASANRTATMPDPATYPGKTLILKVANSNGTYNWVSSRNLKDNGDANITTLANDTVYTLVSDGTNWIITSIY